MNDQQPQKKAKRGVVTSRAKLDAAMVAAGIKSQTALAELIRKTEDLDNPPRDMVSRAFRQIAIDTTSVVRIATALNVDAYTLYLSAGVNSDENLSNNPARIKSIMTVLMVLLLPLLFVLSQQADTPTLTLPQTTPILAKYSLVLHSYTKQTDDLTLEIAKQLQQDFTVVQSNRALLDQVTMSVDIATKYQADGVLTIRNTVFGRYIGLQIYLYFEGLEQLIWTDSFAAITATEQQQQIVTGFIPYLKQALRKNPSKQLIFSDLVVQQNYLQARRLIDDYQSELKLKRAQILLHSAIESFPKFAKAHAALCESYLRDSWRSNEKESLEEAQLACDAALNIAPHQPYAQSMLGYLYHRSGRVGDAIALFKKLLVRWPNNVDALSGLSYAYRAAYQQELTQYPDALKHMLYNAKKITEIEPDYWQHHSTLGLHNYVAGNRLAASHAFAVAARLNPSQMAYVNVGTITMCLGDIDKAQTFYLKAREIAPDSYHGDDYLGTVAFYQKKFNQSSQLKQRALDTFNDKNTGGTHQMWGDLGDAYRRDNQLNNALTAYLQALQIIQRDTLRGNLSASDRIYHHYYSLILTAIAPQQYSQQSLGLDMSQLKALIPREIQSTAQARMAYAFYLYQELELAKQALARAAKVCPIYNKHPDLEHIFAAKRLE